MRSFDGLKACARECMSKKKECRQKECRMFIDFEEDYNCSLIAIYENGPMTLRQIGDRLGISFARVKQIETVALSKMKGNSLIS
jgi:hypothetical protein